MRGTTARRTIAATAATALAAVSLGTASASAGVTGEEPIEVGRAFSNDRYLVLTGTLQSAEACEGTFSSYPGRVVDAPGGVRTFTVRGTYDAELYDLRALGLSSFIEWIIASCTAFATGGEPLEPIATGKAETVFQGRETADGGQYRDSAHGTLVGDDGTRYEVRGSSLERVDVVGEKGYEGIQSNLVVKTR
jgi:hypothetical protein